jgi:hypothetical protein
MAMRAQAGTALGHGNAHTCAREVPPPGPEALQLGPGDELVMVLFPQSTWVQVRQLAEDLHVSHQEVIGAALRLLRARADEELGRR